MNLHSVIKRFFIILFLLFNIFVLAQEDEKTDVKTNSANTFFSSKERQKLVSFSFGYHQPISSGDNFIGKGLEGKSGVNFRFQFYAYKQIILGLATNVSFFDVKDQTILGNYKKTTVNEELLYIGYEFLPVKKLRFGIIASIYGNARFKNKYSSPPNETYQIDHSRLSSYGFYFQYALHTNIHLHIDYSYKIGRTNIDVPEELNSVFKRGSYNSIGFGLTITMGHSDLFSTLFE